MADYIVQLENDYKRIEYIDKFIPSILVECKRNKDFENAVKILKENNITIEELAGRTIRLSINELAKLVDVYLALK